MAKTKPKKLVLPTQEEVVEAIDGHLQRVGMGEATFGKIVCNDFNLVRELRGGRDVRLSLLRKIADRVNAE